MLDQSLIGPRNGYLCGDAITIADYLGAHMVIGGDATGCDLSAYPNITRWLGNMKSLRNWEKVNAAYYNYVVEPNTGKSFERI